MTDHNDPIDTEKNLQPSKAKKLKQSKNGSRKSSTGSSKSKSKKKNKTTKSPTTNATSPSDTQSPSTEIIGLNDVTSTTSTTSNNSSNAPSKIDTNAKQHKRQGSKKQVVSPNTKKKQETEKRKKILRYRRVQSRYKMAKIKASDNLDDVKAKNEQLEKKENENIDNTNETKEPTPEPTTNGTTTATTNTDTTTNTENKDDGGGDDDDNGSDAGSVIMNDGNDDEKDELSDLEGLESFALTDEQESILDGLELAFLESDPDFYGFIPLTKFQAILAKNALRISNKETNKSFEKSLVLIDDGVDYYGFLRSLREAGQEPMNKGKNLLQLLEYMAEKYDFEEESKHIDFSRMRSRSLANLAEQRANEIELEENNPLTPLKRLISDMAYDDDELIDFASLKTALSSIGCNPKDQDLEFLINYLDTTDSEMVDLQYFFQFLHEAVSNKKLWKNLTRLIEYVANQLRRAERAEKTRKTQNMKLQARLEARRRTAQQRQLGSDVQKAMAEEQKRKRAAELRAKAKQFK